MAICCSCIATWIVISAIGYFLYKKFAGKKELQLRKKDWKKDVVYLFQYQRPPKMANYSPYCLKVEMFLRTNNISYENIFTSSDRSQHGLLPFIELNGVQTADSQLILEVLKENFKIKPLSNTRDQGYARSLERMVDVHTSAIFIHYKFKDETGFLDNLLNKIIQVPYKEYIKPLFPLLKPLVHRKIAGRIIPVLGGSLTEEEYHSLLKKDLDALDNVLGDQKFLFGDEIHAVDCSVFAQLATLCYLPFPNEIKKIVTAEYPRLQKYQERIVEKVFPVEFL